MRQVKIVTDSGCDLGKDLLANYEVEMLPIPVQIAGQEYQDRGNIQPAEFYQLLAETEKLPVTSQIPPYTFQQTFDRLLAEKQDLDLIYISFSSQLSGIYNSAQTACGLVDSDRVTVIDSKAASVGQGLMVLKAAKLAQQGKSAAEITNRLQKMQGQIKHIFRVGSLDMLKKGGRISSTKAFIGSILDINPILEIDNTGQIVPLTKIRGEKKAVRYLADSIIEQAADLTEPIVGISHADALPLAKQLADRVESKLEVEEILITEIGAAIGSHAGPGTLALCYY